MDTYSMTGTTNKYESWNPKLKLTKTFAHMWDLKLHYTSTVIYHWPKKRLPSVRLPPASLKSEDFGTIFLYLVIGVSTAESSSQVHHKGSLKRLWIMNHFHLSWLRLRFQWKHLKLANGFLWIRSLFNKRNLIHSCIRRDILKKALIYFLRPSQ